MTATGTDREQELKQTPDAYEIVVKFTRSLEEDLNCGGAALAENVPIGEALLNQFETELQQVYDQLGMAGEFVTVSGPSLVLQKRKRKGTK